MIVGESFTLRWRGVVWHACGLQDVSEQIGEQEMAQVVGLELRLVPVLYINIFAS
jgi:hypothetical protein